MARETFVSADGSTRCRGCHLHPDACTCDAQPRLLSMMGLRSATKEAARAALLGLLGAAMILGLAIAEDVLREPDEGCSSDAECWASIRELDWPPLPPERRP